MSSVMDALQSFTKIEVFENFTCDGCKSHVNIEKQFKVEQAPEVLVIQLKRFQNLGSVISKIQAKVEYQLELDLNPFMSTPEDVSSFSSHFIRFPMHPGIWLMHALLLQKPQNYDLYGVVEHLGVPSNGHYVCFIRSSQTDWFLFDDMKAICLQLVTFFCIFRTITWF
jgi:ubiquitin carboxyl-terminal hydrolase 36/42